MIDQGWGNIRRALEVSDKWSNSVVLLLSDNGGVKRHGSSNAPFKGEKGLYFEGGVRVPAVVAGGYVEQALTSAGIPGGRRCRELFHLTDIFPTFTALAARGTEDQGTNL